MASKAVVAVTHETRESLMRAALREAERGMAEGEAPIGCVIARPEADRPGSAYIVARGHNRSNALQRRNAHAEIIAFENAGGDGRERPAALPVEADDAILVSTLEPCVMCLGAAMEAGVKLVLFGLQAPADNGTQRVKPPQSPEASNPEIVGGILADESRRLFEHWLEQNRGTEQAKFVEQLLALT
jgi:tRNA(adenine34) deaminase